MPAPFVVEMRPFCCDFEVPDSEIPAVNQENWAAARSLLNWAAGPPILESVRAYSPGGDGTFSKLIYSAHWVASPDDASHRQMVVDTKFPGIDPGRLQVKLQFSRPMNSSLSPRATLGRDSRLDEASLSAVSADEGWQKTVYSNDTWVGETVIGADDNITSPWISREWIEWGVVRRPGYHRQLYGRHQSLAELRGLDRTRIRWRHRYTERDRSRGSK